MFTEIHRLIYCGPPGRELSAGSSSIKAASCCTLLLELGTAAAPRDTRRAQAICWFVLEFFFCSVTE